MNRGFLCLCLCACACGCGCSSFFLSLCRIGKEEKKRTGVCLGFVCFIFCVGVKIKRVGRCVFVGVCFRLFCLLCRIGNREKGGPSRERVGSGCGAGETAGGLSSLSCCGPFYAFLERAASRKWSSFLWMSFPLLFFFSSVSSVGRENVVVS